MVSQIMQDLNDEGYGEIYNFEPPNWTWNDQDQLSNNSAQYILEIECQSNCNSSDEINVTFNVCGCMDKQPVIMMKLPLKMMEVVRIYLGQDLTTCEETVIY